MIRCTAFTLAAVLGTGAIASAQDYRYPPGVTKEIHQSIQSGLQWLSRNQANDGSWRNNGGYGSYPAAMTGLAGMALIASGSTPTRGRYWREVRQSVQFLMDNSDPRSGVISVPAEEGRSMYGPGGFIEVGREWPALLRQLERVDGTGYRD